MIKLGLVGTGYINEVHALAAKDLDNVVVNSIFGRSRKKIQRFAQKFGIKNQFDNYSNLLDSNIDAVIIGLPTPLHKDYTIEALNRDKHVLCEKPIALSVKDGVEMKDTAEKVNKILMIGHVLRFWPEYVAVKKMLQHDLTDNIEKITAYRFAPIPGWSSDGWLLDPQKSGGVPVDLQIHDIDFICWFLGLPQKYYSVGTLNGDGLIVNASTILQYKNAIATAEAGYILAKNIRFQMGFKIITHSAVFDYDNLRKPTLMVEKAGKTSEPILFERANPYSNQISYFVKCIKENSSPEQIKLTDAIKSLQISIDVKTSIL